MTKGRFFQEVNLPEQKSYADGVVFPAVLSPASNTCSFIEAIKAQKPWLESLLEKNGVIFFRGFHVETPSDFNDVVEAFGFPEAPYLGGRAPRTKVVGRIYTANEAPPDKRISFHHEMTYVPDFPNKLFFFCEEEPGSGGETPVVLSHIIYEKMKKRHPEFVSRLEEHGLTYIKIMSDEVSSSYFGGSDWSSAYMTDDKNVAEERAAKQETKLEWIENGVKLITGPLPAIRIFGKEDSRRKTWFNILTLLYSGSRNDKTQRPDTFAMYGNGDPVLEYDAIEDCFRIMDEECVIIPWKKGDVMLVNNLMVLHARQPLLKPPRRVLASLCM
ncbi:tauD/TfdA-like domain-containing protein [Artemisia annua]|uniref:TauD/TfdA-like domain-containing protein n=1 Tax=Artemisia annua TaxID=35608 RepID=A0A2U1LL86_ARTAN|nr:tauD/TfdA-like domain-containing protein [Artemisia annua]